MASFAVAGSSVNGGAITVTIPAGSNHAAIMVWWHEDAGGSGGATPTVPGGATASSIFSGTIGFRDFVAYRVTGLSAGSATFTPPSSSGSQGCVVIVFADADQTTTVGTPVTGNAGDDWSPNNLPTEELTGASDGDIGFWVLLNPTLELPSMSGQSSTTLRTSAGPASYGGYIYGFDAPRDGATVPLEASYTGTNGSGSFAVLVLNAPAGGTTVNVSASIASPSNVGGNVGATQDVSGSITSASSVSGSATVLRTVQVAGNIVSPTNVGGDHDTTVYQLTRIVSATNVVGNVTVQQAETVQVSATIASATDVSGTVSVNGRVNISSSIVSTTAFSGLAARANSVSSSILSPTAFSATAVVPTTIQISSSITSPTNLRNRSARGAALSHTPLTHFPLSFAALSWRSL